MYFAATTVLQYRIQHVVATLILNCETIRKTNRSEARLVSNLDHMKSAHWNLKTLIQYENEKKLGSS